MTGPRTLRVLVLEDRADDAEIMILELRGAGVTVDWRRVDNEADFAAAIDPGLDVILADFTLPSFDVLDALAQVQERGLTVPFIIVSGTISEEVAVQCLKRGAADYLVKDRIARLPAAVAAAMDQRDLRDQQRHAAMRVEAQAKELATANAELRHADQLKDRLLAMTAHELRTPLLSILGFAELLGEPAQRSQEDVASWSAIIARQGRLLLQLTDDLLTFSAANLGSLTMAPAALPLAEALAHAVAVAPNGLTAIDCPEDLIAYADPVRFEEMITNLLTNAHKYGGPAVRAEARAAGDYVEVRISDDGPGVPQAFIPQLFDTFSRAADTAQASQGFGLGLAIVHSLARAHGGQAWYEPQDGAGACFAIRLPRPRTESDLH